MKKLIALCTALCVVASCAPVYAAAPDTPHSRHAGKSTHSKHAKSAGKHKKSGHKKSHTKHHQA